MINSVTFMSKAVFDKHLIVDKSTIAISIGTESDGPRKLSRGFAGAIRLDFEDLYEENLYAGEGSIPDLHEKHAEGVRLFWDGYELCDYNDAKKIITFLNHYAAKEEMYTLAVHCTAGISRSSAVAQFANDAYGAIIIGINTDTSYANKRLLRLLNKVRAEIPPTIGLVNQAILDKPIKIHVSSNKKQMF